MSKEVYKFDVVPLEGVGPIKLGMTRSESRAALGEPFVTYRKANSSTMTDTYYKSSFQVFFDEDDRVEFIELSRFPVLAFYKGHSIFELKVEDVVALISKDAQFDVNNPEHEYSYIFPELELSFWRPIIPEIGQDEDDLDGRYFETIGVGKRGYYSTSEKV